MFLIFAALAALIYLPFQDRNSAPAWSAALKPLCALVLCFGLLAGGLSWAVVLAFALCALGDALLTRRSDVFFALGLAAFLGGHVLLFLGLVDVFHYVEGGRYEMDWAVLAALLLALGIGVYVYLWRGVPLPLRGPVAVYILVILAMIWMANTTTLILFAGALMFAASDTVLAVERFRAQRAWMGPFVWLTYASALLLLAYGFMAYR